MTTKPAQKTPKKKAPARPEDVMKAVLDGLAMPEEEFNKDLEAFEEERDRKARAALKKDR